MTFNNTHQHGVSGPQPHAVTYPNAGGGSGEPPATHPDDFAGLEPVVMHVSDEEYDGIVKLIGDPPYPNDELRRLMADNVTAESREDGPRGGGPDEATPFAPFVGETAATHPETVTGGARQTPHEHAPVGNSLTLAAAAPNTVAALSDDEALEHPTFLLRGHPNCPVRA